MLPAGTPCLSDQTLFRPSLCYRLEGRPLRNGLTRQLSELLHPVRGATRAAILPGDRRLFSSMLDFPSALSLVKMLPWNFAAKYSTSLTELSLEIPPEIS